MIVWVAGPRWIDDYAYFSGVLDDAHDYFGGPWSAVVDGGARVGPDAFTRAWAAANGIESRSVKRSTLSHANFTTSFTAKRKCWEIARASDALVAVWDAVEEETARIILFAHSEELPVYVRRVRKPSRKAPIVPGVLGYVAPDTVEHLDG